MVTLPSGSAVVPAHDGDVDWKCLVEKILVAADRHERHYVVDGARVKLASTVTRIDEGA